MTALRWFSLLLMLPVLAACRAEPEPAPVLPAVLVEVVGQSVTSSPRLTVAPSGCTSTVTGPSANGSPVVILGKMTRYRSAGSDGSPVSVNVPVLSSFTFSAVLTRVAVSVTTGEVDRSK